MTRSYTNSLADLLIPCEAALISIKQEPSDVRTALYTYALLLCLAASTLSAKEPNRYSVVTLDNQTPYRIFYSYRWGEGSNTYRGEVKPHSKYNHWWTFDYDNQNWAPWFYIQLDGESGWYKLGSFYRPNTKNGREYAFFETGEGEFKEITIHPKLYTD